jgi:Ca2+-binding EF-hand superfamily protein
MRLLALAFGLVLAFAAARPAAADGLADLPRNVFAAAPALVLPSDVFAHPPGDDVMDVVIFGNARAAFVRVRVAIGGQGYKTTWGEFVVRLHAYLDRNGDGVLTVDEANKAPWTQLLLANPLNGGGAPVIRAGARMVAIDSNPKDGKVTVEELASYLRLSQSFDELGMQPGPPPDPRTEAIFSQLDHDGDKILASAELAESDGFVARLDRDEDEVVSMDELTPERSPFADRFRGGNPNGGTIDAGTSQVVALTTLEMRERVAVRLLNAFHAGDGKGGPASYLIGPEALGASLEAIRAADENGDGKLNSAELKRYLLSPATGLEVAVTLPGAAQGPTRVEKVAAKDKSSLALSTRTANNDVVIQFEGSEIEIRAGDSFNQFGDFFQNQFKAADGDKNGVLDAKEARGNFFMQRIFPVADRNGDSKMTEAEMKGYLDRNDDATRSRTMMTVADRGLALYERLDLDRDNRLSLREIRKARERLEELDRDHDGRISLSELPRRSQLIIGRGAAANRNFIVMNGPTSNGPNRAGRPPNVPAWFVGMDRNNDGDISPREFLGAPEHFRLFDADHDSLIDATEASKLP